MRILMLTQFYPPYIGGEERHVRNLSAHLAGARARGRGGDAGQPRSARVRTGSGRAGLPDTRHDAARHLAVQRFGRRHAPPFPDPELSLELRRIIARERPQIVHAHNWLIHSFLPLKPWSGAKLVLTLHDHSMLCPKKKLIYGDAHCDGPSLDKCLRCVGEHYGIAKGLPVLLCQPADERDRARCRRYVRAGKPGRSCR